MTTDDELAARAAGRIGMVLRGKYHLDRVLGIGGMAVVYAATHRNRKQFAVKVLNQELSFHADTRNRFLREGYVANSVEHPGSVIVLDDDIAEDGAAFLVMELLDGETVEELWARSRRRLPLETVLKIGHDLLDVLAAAHLNGIVHRDVKPANVFLTRAGQVKVLDFGIARLRDVAASQHATDSGILLGTPAFMAPEQALANTSDIDARTDVWAVGALMFTLATGRLVHEAENAIQVLMKAAQEPARSLGVLLPETPSKVTHLIDRALAFDKSARWPSAAAMRDAIADASETLSHRTLNGSLFNARLASPETKDPALAPTLAPDPDTARDEPSARWVQPKGAALLGCDEVAAPAPSSDGFSRIPTGIARTRASAPDVTQDSEDETSKASTEPGKKRTALPAPESAAISSDALTKIRPPFEFDARSTEGLARIPLADARTATMTALSQSPARTETVSTVHPSSPGAQTRPFLAAVSYGTSAHFHVIARSAWNAWPTRLALLARKLISSRDALPKLIGVSALVLALVAGSLILIAVKQYAAHHGGESIRAVSDAPNVFQVPAPVAASEATAPASAEATDAAAGATNTTEPVVAVVAVDDLPKSPSHMGLAIAPASAMLVKPTSPSPQVPSATLPVRPPSRCNPPFDIDSRGTKIWRRGCFP